MGEFMGRAQGPPLLAPMRSRWCSGVTLNPHEVGPTWKLDQNTAPIIASAMDGVVDVPFAIAFGAAASRPEPEGADPLR